MAKTRYVCCTDTACSRKVLAFTAAHLALAGKLDRQAGRVPVPG
jgi:hypothetical protein